jgi:hypothetical protein
MAKESTLRLLVDRMQVALAQFQMAEAHFKLCTIAWCTDADHRYGGDSIR